ncbi:hypothetical protein Tco_0580524 [Tanacetum coccineum]
MVYVVNGVLASGVDMLLEKDLVGFALQKIEIHPLMLLTLSMTSKAANVSTHTLEPSRCFNIIYDYDDDDEESIIPLNEITSQIPSIIPVLPTMEPKDSLIMGDENLSNIPEKESDEFIKSSVEDLVPIPSESGDTSDNDSECDLPLYDDFSPINVPEGKSMTFSNPLFDSNDNFTSSDDESLSDADVPEENVKIYSNPLFEFHDEYISSDVNPLFDEVLEDIESKDSYVSVSKPNPRSNNQISRSFPVSKSSCGMSNGVSLVDHSRNSSSFLDSKHFFCSTCHKCVFNANHDACIKKFLKEVNSRAKVQSPKTKNINKSVEPKSHTRKLGRQIAIGQRFSPKKYSAVHEKSNTPRSCLRWKPTGRIFKIAGLRWIPTGKMFTSSTTKVDSETSNGSNEDISNTHECEKTLDVSAGTLNLSAGTSFNLKKKGLRVWPRSSTTNDVCSHQFMPHSSMTNDVCSEHIMPRSSKKRKDSKKDYEILFQPLFDEYFNPPPHAVSLDPVAVVAQELLIHNFVNYH